MIQLLLIKPIIKMAIRIAYPHIIQLAKDKAASTDEKWDDEAVSLIDKLLVELLKKM